MISDRGDASAVQEESPPRICNAAAIAQSLLIDLKPYPVMKTSGIPWLGGIPEHWAVRRMKTLLRERVQKGFPDEPLLAATQTRGVVRKDQYENRTVLASKDFHLLKLVRPGDFVISLRSFQGGIEYAHEQGIISPAYTILYPLQSAAHAYLVWLFKAKPYIENLALHVTGIRQGQNIDYEKLARAYLPTPPLPEQTAIVRFLDRADRRIRRYIGTKQKLIKLLEEQKRAVIRRAVTRGLDPNVRLKPSGVEWLGDMPEHWEIWQIGRLATVGNGSTPSRSNSAYWSGGTYPWLNSSSTKAATILTSDQFVTDAALRECHLPRVAAGSVLVAITGQGKTRGTAAVLAIEATINQHIAFVTPHMRGKRISPDFLRAFLSAAYSELRRMSDDSGSTKGALTCEYIRHFRTVLPTLEEQKRIVDWTHDTNSKIEDALRLSMREIQLVREYRTRLIADVVTGKVDVREAAAQLPDEADESEESGAIEIPAEDDAEAAEDLADATNEVAAEVDD